MAETEKKEPERTGYQKLFDKLWLLEQRLKDRASSSREFAAKEAVEVAKLVHFEEKQAEMEEHFVKYRERTREGYAYDNAVADIRGTVLECQRIKDIR